MKEIKDFHCTYDNSAGIREGVTRGLGLTFPDAYQHRDTMVMLAKALKNADGAPFCELPFCHTVEAEALGGIVNYGNEKIGEQLLEYMKIAKEYGADLISYADSSGGVNILGPKLMAEVTEKFTYPFLKKAESIADDGTMILLCPKTTLALLGIEKAEFADHRLDGAVSYA